MAWHSPCRECLSRVPGASLRSATPRRTVAVRTRPGGDAASLPLQARAGLGYTALAPGQANDARRIFVNDATNGTPEMRGWSWNYRFDLTYPIGGRPAGNLLFFGGPRYSRYTANFKYIGGNEDFDVTSTQWGFGAGLESSREMNARTSIVASAGVDYYLESAFYGHGTAYSPDGQDVNPGDGYDYTDADAAVDQPRLVGRVVGGLRYRF